MKKGILKEEKVVKISITSKRAMDSEEVYKLAKLIAKKKRKRSN
jgi:hypothetical protein